MTSQKQLEANKKNAQLGGVKTDEGKAITKLNALKHGLLTMQVLLEGEEEESLLELHERLKEDLKPNGEIEMLLVDRIISNAWRLRRLLEVERTVMEWRAKRELNLSLTFGKGEESGNRHATREMLVNDDIEKLLRYEITIERSIYKALHELQRLQAVHAGVKLPAPMAIDIDFSRD